MSDKLAETYYKETNELATCKERKIEMVLNAIYDIREKTVIEMLINMKTYSGKKINNMEELDQEITNLMVAANESANKILDYYIGDDIMTKDYSDIYGPFQFDEFE